MTTKIRNKPEPDYEGFCTHMKEYDRAGAPVEEPDLIRIARLYDTPVPKRKYSANGVDWEWDWTGTDMENTNPKK